MEKIKLAAAYITGIVSGFLPLFTDTNNYGKRKVSIGRAPLLVILVTMCKHYIVSGTGPDVGILAFVGMAMAYNGFSKTKSAGGNGSENTVTGEE